MCTLSVFRPPFFFSWCPLKLDDQDQNSNRTTNIPDSKHRFTTSFLQPLPYLVLRWGPENCQLMSNFCWYSNSSKFVAKNSDYQTFVLQRTMLLTSAQKKTKLFESRQNSFSFFYPGWRHLTFNCVLGR